jgi:hypothetical protein
MAVAELQNIARHVPNTALVLLVSGQHLNRLCNSNDASRCDEVSRQAQMANSTKCRDSLQPCMAMALSCVLTPLVHAECSRDLWSFAGLHPPKMRTFSGSHSNAAYGRSCTTFGKFGKSPRQHLSYSRLLVFAVSLVISIQTSGPWQT